MQKQAIRLSITVKKQQIHKGKLKFDVLQQNTIIQPGENGVLNQNDGIAKLDSLIFNRTDKVPFNQNRHNLWQGILMEVDFKEYRALFERPLVLFDSIFVPYSNAFVEDKTNYLSVSLSNITLLFMPAWILSLYFGELELHSSSQVSWGTADFIWTALERCSLVLLGNFFKFYSMLFNDTCNTQKNQLKRWWKRLYGVTQTGRI